MIRSCTGRSKPHVCVSILVISVLDIAFRLRTTVIWSLLGSVLFSCLCCRWFVPFSFFFLFTAEQIPQNLKNTSCRHILGFLTIWYAAVTRSSIPHLYLITNCTESLRHLLSLTYWPPWPRTLQLHFALWTFDARFNLYAWPVQMYTLNHKDLVLHVRGVFLQLFSVSAPLWFCFACVSSFRCWTEHWVLLLCSRGAKVQVDGMWYNSFGLLATYRVSYTRRQIWLKATVPMRLLHVSFLFLLHGLISVLYWNVS